MTLVSGIVRDALRESNLVARQQTSPTDETTEVLARLEAVVRSTLGNDVGYIMEDWNVVTATNIKKPSGVSLTAAQAAAYTVPPNARLVGSLTAAAGLLLDPQPQDGARLGIVDAKNNFGAFNLTLNPNGRKIGGSTANLVLSTNSDARDYFYRADIADWKRVSPLVLTDEFIFPADFDDYFVVALALRVNPRYGKMLGDDSKARLEQQRAQIITRYSQTRLNTGGPAE